MQKVKELLRKCYNQLQFFFRAGKVENMTIVESKKLLDAYYHQKPPKFQQKVSYNPEYDVMIIVPVYNTEKFLEECVKSILEQKTKYSYQVVFVDDGSTDQSGAILDRYRENENVKVIHQKNKGIGNARNQALQNLCARYVMFVDSDDILAEHAVELLMNVAMAKNADIVEGAHIEFSDNIPIETNKREASISGYPWGKVIAAEKMKNLCFPEGYLFEDTIIETLLLPICKVVCTIPEIVYYYRKNQNSVTATFDEKKECIDTVYMTYFCLRESLKRKNEIELETFLRQVRLNWLRTQKTPAKIQKAIFIAEIEMFYQYWGEEKTQTVKAAKKLEKVLRKRWFCAYEWLMHNWQNWDI